MKYGVDCGTVTFLSSTWLLINSETAKVCNQSKAKASMPQSAPKLQTFRLHSLQSRKLHKSQAV